MMMERRWLVVNDDDDDDDGDWNVRCWPIGMEMCVGVEKDVLAERLLGNGYK